MSDIPGEYICPITLEIMSDPVIASDGFSYDRSAIESYFNSRSSYQIKSLRTNEPFANKNLVANVQLKLAIKSYLETYKQKPTNKQQQPILKTFQFSVPNFEIDEKIKSYFPFINHFSNKEITSHLLKYENPIHAIFRWSYFLVSLRFNLWFSLFLGFFLCLISFIFPKNNMLGYFSQFPFALIMFVTLLFRNSLQSFQQYFQFTVAFPLIYLLNFGFLTSYKLEINYRWDVLADLCFVLVVLSSDCSLFIGFSSVLYLLVAHICLLTPLKNKEQPNDILFLILQLLPTLLLDKLHLIVILFVSIELILRYYKQTLHYDYQHFILVFMCIASFFILIPSKNIFVQWISYHDWVLICVIYSILYQPIVLPFYGVVFLLTGFNSNIFSECLLCLMLWWTRENGPFQSFIKTNQSNTILTEYNEYNQFILYELFSIRNLILAILYYILLLIIVNF